MRDANLLPYSGVPVMLSASGNGLVTPTMALTDAVTTIIEMRKRLDEFNRRLAEQSLPPVGMRAGMTSGMMVVGDAGSRSEDEKHTAAD